jgi:subtilisin family serine protease
MEKTLDFSASVFRLDEVRHGLAHGTGKGVRIAIIDSGIEVDHPDLGGLRLLDDLHVIDGGVQIEVKPGDGSDVFGHGTAIAAVIHRIAPEAELGSIRVLSETLGSRTAIIREGVRQAIDRSYQILNCSFGCGLEQHIFQYKEWIDEAYLRDIHIVSACNNDDFTKPEWPGYFPTVITVNMARANSDEAIYFKSGNLVEFAARAVNVEVPWNHHSRREVTGSSFAAPVVVGLLARLLSVVKGLTPLEAKSLLRRLATPWTRAIAGQNVSYTVETI